MTKIVTYAMAKPYESMIHRFKKITSLFLLGITLVLGGSALVSSKAEAATPPTPREVHQVRLERHKKAVQHRKEVRKERAEARKHRAEERKKHAEIRKEHRSSRVPADDGEDPRR